MGLIGLERTRDGEDVEGIKGAPRAVISRHGTIGQKGGNDNMLIYIVVSRFAEIPKSGYGVDIKGG